MYKSLKDIDTKGITLPNFQFPVVLAGFKVQDFGESMNTIWNVRKKTQPTAGN